MGGWKGRGNQYIQFIRVLYCKLPNGKQLPAFPLEAVPGTKPLSQRWEVRVLPLCHCGPDKRLRQQVDLKESGKSKSKSGERNCLGQETGSLAQELCFRWQ